MHLNVFASQNCFVYCKGCYSLSREEEKGKNIPTKQLLDFLKFAYSTGCKKITLCGGDPLTRNDIIELLEKIKEIGFSITLDTVGSSIIKDIVRNNEVIVKQTDAEKIANLVDMIGIPIDGSTNEIFKLFRPTKSDLVNEQIAICEELHKFNATICINTVAHKGNLTDSRNLAGLIKNLDYIKKWQIFQYEPLGRYGLRNRQLFEITDEEFLNFQSEILEVYGNNTGKIQFKSFNNRQNIYMLIDNSGNAWIPSKEKMSSSKCSYNLNEDTIIGNITNPKDWVKICSYLDKDF